MYGAGPCYIPDVHEAYAAVARALRTEGTYRADVMNPPTESVDWTDWDGVGYRITKPYAQRERHRPGSMIEFRHCLSEIFNGLLQTGFSIQHALESPAELPAPEAQPGSYADWSAFVGGGFTAVAQKRSDPL